MNISSYTNLAEVRRHLALSDDDSSDDNHLLNYMRQSQAFIDNLAKRSFSPVKKLLYFDHVDGNTVCLSPHDILEVSELLHYAGSSAIASSNYYLMTGDDYNMSPYSFLDLSSTCSFSYGSSKKKSIVLNAIIGYHEDYSNAWQSVGASLPTDMATSDTSISVASAVGDSWGLDNRFSIGHIIRVDDEFMYVFRAGSSLSSFYVVRGINGTVAASHASGADITRFEVDPDVKAAATWLTAFRYHKSKSPYTGKQIAFNMGFFEVMDAMPTETRDAIKNKKKSHIYAASL